MTVEVCRHLSRFTFVTPLCCAQKSGASFKMEMGLWYPPVDSLCVAFHQSEDTFQDPAVAFLCDLSLPTSLGPCQVHSFPCKVHLQPILLETHSPPPPPPALPFHCRWLNSNSCIRAHLPSPPPYRPEPYTFPLSLAPPLFSYRLLWTVYEG